MDRDEGRRRVQELDRGRACRGHFLLKVTQVLPEKVEVSGMANGVSIGALVFVCRVGLCNPRRLFPTPLHRLAFSSHEVEISPAVMHNGSIIAGVSLERAKDLLRHSRHVFGIMPRRQQRTDQVSQSGIAEVTA
jgi:hypothetical protein